MAQIERAQCKRIEKERGWEGEETMPQMVRGWSAKEHNKQREKERGRRRRRNMGQ